MMGLVLSTCLAAAPAGPAVADPRWLRVEVPGLTLAEPLTLGADGAAAMDSRAGRQPAPAGPAGPAPAPRHPDWTIVRGGHARVDEAEVARALHEGALVRRIARGRRAHQVAWTAGLGAPSVAAAGAGAYLLGWGRLPSSDPRRDARALGASLVAVGVLGAVLGVLVPILSPPHVLDQDEAEALCATYNARLLPAAAP